MTGRVIAVVSSKGGCGKTSTVANLAVRAAKDKESNGAHSRVALLDLDPQQALARWYELRCEFVFPLLKENAQPNLKLFKNVQDARSDVELLKEQGWNWIFIDTPPAMMEWIEMAVAAADIVLIPVRASPIDLESIDVAIEFCKSYGRPFAFVPTHYDKKWKLSSTAIPVLEEHAAESKLGKVLKKGDEILALTYRQAYVGSMLAGRTGPEFKGDKKQATDAAEEVDAMWLAIKRFVQQSVKLAKV
jgi:chromosome partitioning protein